MKEGLIEAIKERGYWRINFRPTVYHRNALESLAECKRLVESSSVEKRGWDYPHVVTRSDDHSGAERHGDFIEHWIDWQNHREFWRMYTSGQFIHYVALREDWVDLDAWVPGQSATEVQDAMKQINAVGLNWQLSEIFEFLSRIAKQGIYDAGVEVSLTLFGTSERKLAADFRRAFLMSIYSTEASSIEFKRTYSREEIADPRECSLDVIAYFFDRFGWNPPKDQLRTMQDELYALRMGHG